MSQANRILKYLEEHPEGLHSFIAIRDMWILRVSERIRELKATGHHIISVPEKMGRTYGVRYILEY